MENQVESPQMINLDPQYQAGVCNIGSAEIAVRKRTLYISLIGLLVYIVILRTISLPQFFQLGIFFIILGMGVSYFQVSNKFCVYYGSIGVTNFGEKVGKGQRIRDDLARKLDKRKVQMIFLKAFILALISTPIIIYAVF